ncbi:hypothetical protein IM660_08090 [Ruania alkalisoli]|uniref:Uncharacterized protein n=1 Tax=Ruania alkalisoli TaxID=2779775 RepID=A0A7M1SX73_9MICO|nr:hypothetical protein [Ruania alkalisoli]QOR72178.1 hypothetical protein IM660_08090 [Ruania alkalisoli]
MRSLDDRRATYLRLGTGELAASAAFAVAYLLLRDRFTGDEQLALGAALTPLLLILVQAGFYWLLARHWMGVRVMPPALAGAYSALRWINPIVLAVSLGVLVWHASTIGTAVLGAGLWLFAVIEHLNYYVIRLAYPASQWLSGVGQRRTPQLMNDVREGREPDRSEGQR